LRNEPRRYPIIRSSQTLCQKPSSRCNQLGNYFGDIPETIVDRKLEVTSCEELYLSSLEFSFLLTDTSSGSLPIQSSRPPGQAIVPFNVLETRNWDLFAAFSWIFHPDPLSALRERLREFTGQQNILFAPSGECAIAQILSLLPQKEVVIPAWICHQVKEAAEIAGKRVIYVDLAKNGINATSSEYDEAAKPGRILLAAHLFGVPTDIEAICKLAKSRDCVTIEDAVPAIGGMLHGRPLGTFGDFGVFSFQQSKRVSAFRGGVIVVNNDKILDPAKLDSARVTPTARTMPVAGLAMALAQNFATAPGIYRWLTLRMLPLRGAVPALLRNMRPAAPAASHSSSLQPVTAPRNQYYTREIHPYQAELVLRVLRRMEAIREHVVALAEIYMDVFRNTPIETFVAPGSDTGGLMRFPIAFSGKNREEILRLALKRGLYMKVLWSRPLPEESEYSRFPNAVWAAQNLVLLPLYTALSTKAAELLALNVVDVERNALEKPAR
jgi:dTDP-4-amino-4,6-dideoxygalactose transaminase